MHAKRTTVVPIVARQFHLNFWQQVAVELDRLSPFFAADNPRSSGRSSAKRTAGDRHRILVRVLRVRKLVSVRLVHRAEFQAALCRFGRERDHIRHMEAEFHADLPELHALRGLVDQDAGTAGSRLQFDQSFNNLARRLEPEVPAVERRRLLHVAGVDDDGSE